MTNLELADAEVPKDLQEEAADEVFVPTLYPWRFAVVFGVFTSIFANNILFGVYGGCTPTVAEYYVTSNNTINMLNLANTISFLFAVGPATWLLDTYGIRYGVMTSSCLSALGALLRYLTMSTSNQATQVALLFVGSVLVGLATPFSMDAPTKAAAHWFSGEGRLLANAVMGLATPIGGAAGLFIGPLIVSKDATSVPTLNLIAFIVAAACALGSLLVYNNPPTPPSKSAQKGTMVFREGLRAVVKNGAFWVLSGVFACTFTTLQVMSTFLSNYVTPYGFSEDDSGNIGVAVVGCGIVAAVGIGAYLDRSKQHRLALKVLSGFIVIGMVLFYVGCVNGNIGVLYTGGILLGIGSLPILSISMELGAECTYPVPEATSSGILMTGSQIIVIIMFIISNALTDAATQQMSKHMILLIVLAVAGCGSAFMYRAHNLRMELENGV
ncbi:major facilitator superfamily domain-containing protein [Chytriomyces sp. MP71]|nr:major facilitator superfamily domain-containing protein [Chytriomyces sp. MP71]